MLAVVQVFQCEGENANKRVSMSTDLLHIILFMACCCRHLLLASCLVGISLWQRVHCIHDKRKLSVKFHVASQKYCLNSKIFVALCSVIITYIDYFRIRLCLLRRLLPLRPAAAKFIFCRRCSTQVTPCCCCC